MATVSGLSSENRPPLKQVFVRACCQTAYHTGLLGLATRIKEPFTGASGARPFQILVYHRVGKNVGPFTPGVPVAAFERQMRYVSTHFRVLSLTDLVNAAQQGAVPSRAIAITFDDGYEEMYTHVAPILRRYQVPITVYLATSFMHEGQPMWNDRLGIAIRDTERSMIEGLPQAGPLPLKTGSERLRALHQALDVLKRREPSERDELTAGIIRALGVRTDGGPRMLRWQQVEDLATQGIEFGAHTVHHPILTAIPTGTAEREIVESKSEIENRLQKAVHHFAYPNGTKRDFNDTIKALVKKAGYSSAVSMIFGTNTFATDRYAWRRGGSWEEATALFAAKLWWYRSTAIDRAEASQPFQVEENN